MPTIKWHSQLDQFNNKIYRQSQLGVSHVHQNLKTMTKYLMNIWMRITELHFYEKHRNKMKKIPVTDTLKLQVSISPASSLQVQSMVDTPSWKKSFGWRLQNKPRDTAGWSGSTHVGKVKSTNDPTKAEFTFTLMSPEHEMVGGTFGTEEDLQKYDLNLYLILILLCVCFLE